MQKNKCLQDALRELVSIVEIHADATGNNFAWAELVEARAALAEQEVDMEHKHTPGPWSAEPPNPEPEYGEHEKKLLIDPSAWAQRLHLSRSSPTERLEY